MNELIESVLRHNGINPNQEVDDKTAFDVMKSYIEHALDIIEGEGEEEEDN